MPVPESGGRSAVLVNVKADCVAHKREMLMKVLRCYCFRMFFLKPLYTAEPDNDIVRKHTFGSEY
jgi:hypothetical protein